MVVAVEEQEGDDARDARHGAQQAQAKTPEEQVIARRHQRRRHGAGAILIHGERVQAECAREERAEELVRGEQIPGNRTGQVGNIGRRVVREDRTAQVAQLRGSSMKEGDVVGIGPIHQGAQRGKRDGRPQDQVHRQKRTWRSGVIGGGITPRQAQKHDDRGERAETVCSRVKIRRQPEGPADLIRDGPAGEAGHRTVDCYLQGVFRRTPAARFIWLPSLT
jgi:hypothetical protein